MRQWIAGMLVAMTAGAIVCRAEGPGGLSWPAIDSTPVSAPALTLDPAAAAPRFFQITAIFEDDGTFVKPYHNTDRHYTAGESLSIALQIPLARAWGGAIPSFHEFDPTDMENTTYALGITGTQQMFTPEDLSTPAPIPTDEPYAGYLYGGLYLERATAPTDHWGLFEHFELDIGVIGPAAQGRQTQTYVHDHFGATPPQGWDNQIHDEVGFNAKYIRKWRFDLLGGGTPWGLQLIPQAGATIGTFDRNLSGSATARFGVHLPDDFGPVRIADLPSATARRFYDAGGYLFLRAGGRVVEHSTVLQGNNFRDYPQGVEPDPVVGELNGGFAIEALKHVEFGWNWTLDTQEFRGQKGDDSYGTMYLSAFWQF